MRSMLQAPNGRRRYSNSFRNMVEAPSSEIVLPHNEAFA